MTPVRMDNILVVVDDLEAAIAFSFDSVWANRVSGQPLQRRTFSA